jgi:hypothetical protein
MKKTLHITVAALIIASVAFTGCKKGEGDPFLSIKSRKARVAGDWKVTAGSGKIVNGTTSDTWTYDGTTMTDVVVVGSSSPVTSTTSITMTFNFEKDGTYTMVQTTQETTNTETYTETGTWNFTAGVGEDKCKDHLVLRTLVATTADSSPASSSTTTYTGDNAPASIYYIYQLKSKEMILKWDGSTQSGSSSASTNMGEFTLTAQ